MFGKNYQYNMGPGASFYVLGTQNKTITLHLYILVSSQKTQEITLELLLGDFVILKCYSFPRCSFLIVSFGK